MSEVTYIGATGNSAEGVDARFIKDGLRRAQKKSWAVLHEIKNRLRSGMTESEARELALVCFNEAGSTKYWHQPYVRFGPGTALTFHDKLQPDYRLNDGDSLYLDLGPVWSDSESELEYEGDVGDSFVFGVNAERQRCADAARTLWKEGRDFWLHNAATGAQLYELFNRRATEMGYRLVPRVDGHRVSDYPHTQYAKHRLAKAEFKPSSCLWILEFQINDLQDRFGAFYENLLE